MSQSPVCMPLERWQDLVEVACMATGHWRERFWVVASFPVELLVERLRRQSSERKGSRLRSATPGTNFRLKPYHGFCPLAPARSANCGTIAARCCARIAGACAFRVVAVVAPCTTRMNQKNIDQFRTSSTIRKTKLNQATPLTIQKKRDISTR